MSWAVQLWLQLLSLCQCDDWIFYDLGSEDLTPDDGKWCQEQLPSTCIADFHIGRAEFSQQHREAQETLKHLREGAEDFKANQPLSVRLLVLVTTVWPNFQRRQLLRQGMTWCRRGLGGRGNEVVWRFLLGDLPGEHPEKHPLLQKALREAEAFGDLMLVGGADEIQYRHIGDAYVLPEANPELWKLLVALRRLRHEVSYDYLLVADDDNFISLTTAVELLEMLPPTKVYVGNMIDTVPQRFDMQKRRIVQETSVNLYMGSPSKLPIFAHGLGFIVSQDLAKLLADRGLSFKLRGNDDMLVGLWLRSIADVRFLHYHIWFHDHHEFGGLFSRPCQQDAVIVHRMTEERWRTFDRYECHVCGSEKPVAEALALLNPLEPSPAELVVDLEELPEVTVQELARLGRTQQELRKQRSREIYHFPLKLAILIFGSRWQDFRLRAQLRRALSLMKYNLGSKSSESSGKALQADFQWLFVMTRLLPDTRVHAAYREILVHRDMMRLGPSRLPRSSQAAQKAGKVRKEHEIGCYRYEEAWRLVEERWGGADFVLLLDHRSYINVPQLLAHMPRWPRHRLMHGVLLDESVFAGERRMYLWRRRAAVFAHGMGIVVSADVARFVAELALEADGLSQVDVPADVAFGQWVQLLEDMEYSPAEDFWELPISASSLALSADMTLAWPMTLGHWRSYNATDSARAPATKASSVTLDMDCWKGMGGRAESWYLVCCDLGWSGCWGGEFTAEMCCSQVPGRAGAPPSAEPVLLQRFLNFDDDEFTLFLQALDHNHTQDQVGRGRFRCLTPQDCGKEAFARFYQASWETGILPLRHPWFMDVEDHLFGVIWKMRAENRGGNPAGHEHTFERKQMAKFLQHVSETVSADEIFVEHGAKKLRRCLEWDSGAQSRFYFSKHCDVVDVITYFGDGHAQLRVNADSEKRDYFLDIHIADQVVPENSTGLVICSQVFEHLLKPWLAMRQLYRLLGPGGLLAWSAPLFSQIHGSPQDFWRFTPEGARTLAEEAGFEIVEIWAPGTLRELAGYLLGLTAPYWTEDAIMGGASDWPLQVYMLARKPA
ncbi:GALT3 [Symbiodinium sp. CCMP2456]|nr:GALT3 [Symbiodinium sp. CCMP2456]